MLNTIYKTRNVFFMIYLSAYIMVIPFTFTHFVNSLVWHFATFILLIVVLTNNAFDHMEVKEHAAYNITFIIVMLMNLMILGRFLFDTSLRIGNLNIWSLNEAYLNMNYTFCALLIFGIIIINALIILKEKLSY